MGLLWGGAEAHSLTGSALPEPASQPRGPGGVAPECRIGLSLVWRRGVDGCDSMSRGRCGVRYVKAPARGCLASGARGAAGTAARLTLGPGHRVRRGTGSRLGGGGAGGGRPSAPRGCAQGWVCPPKGRLRGTSERPLRWKGPGFLAASPSQGWGRSPMRVTFCREPEKASTQCSGPASGLHLIRSAFIGRKR